MADANLTRFAASVGYARDSHVDYPALHRWSLDDPDRFWAHIWEWCGVIGSRGDAVLDPGTDMQSAQFFPEARLNFTENLLRQRGAGDAILAWGEGKDLRRLSWDDLRHEVTVVAHWLQARGVKEGDRVAAIMPNVPETIIAFLAAAAIGAVFSSASPDFGERGIVDRFGQIAPKVLIAADGYVYNGKTIDIREKVAAVRAALPSVETLVVIPYMDLGDVAGAISWHDVRSTGSDDQLAFRRRPFHAPLYTLFSSGTTGKPKCIVHSAGGALLQHLKEHRLHCDIKPGDRVFYFTTCGWMMWNWLVSALASKATILLYDGSPFHPDGNVLFDFAATERATFFGTSAKFIDSVKKAGLSPIDTHDLSAVRTIASTGSPLVPDSFDFIYQHIKSDVHLASISGGTDIVSCFVLGNPCAPVHRGEIQAPGLGMAVEVWSDQGRRVRDEPGELVCTKPFPSMPIGFWNDDDGSKYRAAYFEKFPGVWAHGDYVVETGRGGFVILGRSDATLNPGGVRIGTAEIYAEVEPLEEISECLAVGQAFDGDTRIVLFVVLQAGSELDDKLVQIIKDRVRRGASPRHVPARIVAVPDLPRTKSGKISELAVRDTLHGRPVANTEALANPESLDAFRDRPELRH